MPKKLLYNGTVIDVDPQIIRWRKKRIKLGLAPARKKHKKRDHPADLLLVEILRTRGGK